METKRKIYLHIGLHKTGSTYLQKVLFPNMQNDSICALVGRDIASFGTVALGNKLLISEENLSACPYAGRPPRALDLPWDQRFKNAVNALGQLCPDAYVIMGVRKHGRWLLSLYRQYLHQGGMKPFDAFFDISGRDQGVIKQDDLLLRPRVDLIRKLFLNGTFVYNASDLRKKRQKMLTALCAFMEEDLPRLDADLLNRRANKGVEHYQAKLLRMLNHVDHVRIMKKHWSASRILCQKVLANWPKRRLELPDKVDAYIKERYAEDWEYVLKSCFRPLDR